MPHPDLIGSVKEYERHVFLATGRSTWPSHLDQDPGLLGRIAIEIDERGETFAAKTKVTAIDDAPRAGALDVIVFPEGIRYVGVDEARWRTILEEHLEGGHAASGLPVEPFAGRHVFVCVHGARDERCGACGPPLVARIEREIVERPMHDWHVHRTSHVGGHKYAGNVLIFPPGDWYGYVGPDDIPAILDAAVAGRTVDPLWRGRIGKPPAAP